MWEREVDGRPLRFHLSGINNQNFMMRDEETGSWWQQVSGAAIQGPLKGKRLNAIFTDEVSFAVWKREHPQGRVLRPDEKLQARYASAEWEREIEKLPLVAAAVPGEPAPRTLMAGLVIDGQAMAYPVAELKRQRLMIDTIKETPVFLVSLDEGRSIRAFERRVDGHTLEFFIEAGSSPLRLVDAETGSVWDFSGAAVSGQLAGRQLKKIAVLKDYWFDWKTYHPETAVYTFGARAASKPE